jgi:hypothetical protein
MGQRVRFELVERRIAATDGGPDARLFTGPRGGRITTAVLRDATHWDEVVTRLGYEHLRRHDLFRGLPCRSPPTSLPCHEAKAGMPTSRPMTSV